jgi:hypothetical protein
MIEDMTIHDLSRSTQQSYIYPVAKFGRHFNRPPDRLGMEDVHAYCVVPGGGLAPDGRWVGSYV